MTTKTPYHLRKWVPEDAGPDRALSRLPGAYCGPNRKEFNWLYFVQQMSGAIPEHGQKEKVQKHVPQTKFAAMSGIRPETASRRIGKFGKSKRAWKRERREKRSQEMRKQCREQGKKIRDRELRAIEPVADLVKITPRVGKPNLYKAPHYEAPPKKDNPDAPTVAEVLATMYGDELFNPNYPANGYKYVPQYLWHPNLPDPEICACKLGQTALEFQEKCPLCNDEGIRFSGSLNGYARTIATYYLLKGIERKGWLQKPQKEIAADLGMDPETFSKHNHKLVLLGIVKVVPGEKTRDVEGNIISSEADKTIWMPGKYLDREICAQEMDRYCKWRQKMQDTVELCKADLVHTGLLKEWEGQEHKLQAFWNELRRRLVSAGVSKTSIDALVPFYRE